MKTIFNFIKKNRNIILLIISFVFLTMLILGMTYAYFDLKTGGETESTMNIGGAEISATYAYSNSINITDALPGNDIIAYKDITLTYKNTSSEEYKVYLKTVIDYSTFTNTENDGVLYYDIYSGTDHSTLVQDKIIFPTKTNGKAILKEISIPANSTGTLNYRINFYFPESNKLQNPDGQLVLNASISVENDNSLKYTPTLLKKLDLMYQYESGTNGLEQDDTTNKNIRYVGASPKNYLKFNNEIWRIIGVFNNITTIDELELGKEKKELLVKIVRNESLGNYSWDTTDSTINNGDGINEWSQADLMYELNCDGSSNSIYCRDETKDGYLSDITSGTVYWYDNKNNSKVGKYDYSKNIKISAINQIANVEWNLGGTSSGTSSSASALSSYTQERGTTHVSNPADGVTRTNTWDGKIGLMYPSDYGYASTNKACRNQMNSSTNNEYNCKYDNWLFTGLWEWTFSPYYNNTTNTRSIYSDGRVYVSGARNGHAVRPALFLKSDVVISGGTGIESDPYVID